MSLTPYPGTPPVSAGLRRMNSKNRDLINRLQPSASWTTLVSISYICLVVLSQQQTSVLSQQQASVLSQQKTSILSQQKT